MKLTLRELAQPSGLASPFEQDVEGFEEPWWRSPWTTSRLHQSRCFSFTMRQKEVARAEVEPGHSGLVERYPGWTGRAIDVIAHIEVRAGYRLQGIGELAIQELGDVRDLRTLVAYPSAVAEGFWDEIGWDRYDASQPHLPPLFVGPRR